MDATRYETGGFRIDVTQRALLAADGSRIPLSSRAFELLLVFVRHPSELLDKDRLMAAVWPNTVVEENNLTQCIGALRKALGESRGENRFLVTEPGRGYRFVAAVSVLGEELPSPDHDRAPRRWPWWLGIAVVAAGLLATWLANRAPPDRSIAVLPFENRSAAPENGYLALGIQDEVLTLLTRVGDLRVISRNSTQRYASSTADARRIGRELGVAYLLEGNVQRAGDTVRVSVALIDAVADRHLWAESYERSATDVFAVESEVAQSVASALRARLSDEERAVITRPPSTNPAAYDAYLRARAFAERTTRTEGEIRAAIGAFEDAVRIDPDFAIAWAQLSRRHANFYSLAYDRSAERKNLAQHALQEAMRLAPDLPETQAAHGYYQFVVEGDLEGAENAFRALESRAPQSADAAAGLAQITRELGQMGRSADYERRVLALDPLNPYRHAIVCLDYLTAREFELAAKTCARALDLLPGDTGILALRATIHQALGELDRSRTLLRSLSPAAGDWRTLRAMSRQFLLEREPEAAAQLLDRYLAHPEALGTRRGVVRRWLADARRLAGDPTGAVSSYALARDELAAVLADQPENPVLLAELVVVQARLGNRGAALKAAELCARSAAHPRRDGWLSDCALANIQTELATGDPTRAVALLKEAVTTRGSTPPLTPSLLRLDPDFDALRERADFRSLL